MANPLDTMIGAGVVKLKEIDVDVDYVDIGECDVFRVSITQERKDYRSKRSSQRRIVRTATISRSAEIAITMNEANARNLAIYLQGTLTDPVGPAPYSTIDLLAKADARYLVRFIGTTDIGQSVQVDATVDFTPTDSLDLLGDDWVGLQLSGQVLEDSDNYGPGRMLVGITEEVTA